MITVNYLEDFFYKGEIKMEIIIVYLHANGKDLLEREQLMTTEGQLLDGFEQMGGLASAGTK